MSDLANSLNLLPPNRSPLEVATATVCVPKVDASVVQKPCRREVIAGQRGNSLVRPLHFLQRKGGDFIGHGSSPRRKPGVHKS